MQFNVDRRVRRRAGVVLAGAVCAGLLATAVSPVWASDGDMPGAPGSVVVGAFPLADAIEGTLDERDGSFSFSLPVGGPTVTWDSRKRGVDRYRLGHGLTWGMIQLETEGGVLVSPKSGGSHTPDPTHPSGLAGYGVEDAKFEQMAGVLPGRLVEVGDARADVPAGVLAAITTPTEVAYGFVLHELGGDVTYFNEAGDVVASMTSTGDRLDLVWDERVPHRLIGTINPHGVLTTLDWESEPGAVVVRPAVNLPAERDEDADASWRLELEGGRLAHVTTATGDRASLSYDDEDPTLVSAIEGASGGRTEFVWRTGDDGVSRMERVRTTDASGAELSSRVWAVEGEALSSGWPEFGGDGEVFWSGDPAFRYRTTVTDGATKVRSEYNSSHLLVHREVMTTSGSGEVSVQVEEREYPGTEDGGVADPAALPANWLRPTTTATTHRDARGASRTDVETAEHDALGRPTRHVGIDGAVTEMTYDEAVPEQRVLPIGHPLTERVTAADGLVSETKYTLNAAGTAPERIERWETQPHGEPTLVELTEQRVQDDGFVLERREIALPEGEPRVTAWTREVDLASGRIVETETTRAGSPSEATTTRVRSMRHDGELSVTDAVGNTASSVHDAAGRVVEHRDAAGRATRTEYETRQADGRNAVTETKPDGVATTTIADPLGRIVEVVDNIRDGAVDDGYVRTVERREYPSVGVEVVIDAWGARTTTVKDLYDRTIAKTDGTGVTEVTRFDDVANTATQGVTATGDLADAEQTVTKQRDSSGRVTREESTRRDGRTGVVSEVAFDGAGRSVLTSDGIIEQRTEHDALGRPARTTHSPVPGTDVAEASGILTEQRRFDGFGTSVEKTLADGTRSRSGGARTLDGDDRTATKTDQLDRVTRYEHTPDGLESRIEFGSGAVTEHEYDPTTRALISTVTTSPVGETVRTSYEHDPITDALVGVWDPADRAGTEIRSTYDAYGNPRTVTYPDDRVIAYRYDANGRRTGVTDVADNATEFEYGADGRLTRVAQEAPDGVELAEASYTYDDLGRLRTLERGNGVVTTTTYTSASEVESQRTEKDGRLLSLREYAYDVRGNLTSRTDTTVDPGEAGDAKSVATTEYAYDAHDRLVRSTERDGDTHGTVTRETVYELSVSDDILAETVTTHPGTASAESVTRTFGYSPLGELIDIATTRTGADAGVPGQGADQVEPGVEHRVQRYDSAGNRVLAFDGTETVYDAANRPIVETTADGSTTRFAYWADGTRREQSTEHGTFGYYWDGTSLINDTYTATEGAAGTGDDGTAAYLLGAARHARSVTPAGAEPGGADVEYLGADRHQNITDLTDEAGELTARYTYSDYGIQNRIDLPDAAPATGLARNPFGYAGELTDENGNQYLRARVYDVETMRFTTLDSEELHNLYAYADLNPVTKLDPTGRSALGDDWFADIFVPIVVGLLALATVVATLIGSPAAGAAVGYLNHATSLALVGVGFYVQAAAEKLEERNEEGERFTRTTLAVFGLATAIVGFGLSRTASILSGLYRDGTFGKLAASFRDSAKSLFSRPAAIKAPAAITTPKVPGPINGAATNASKHTPTPSNSRSTPTPTRVAYEGRTRDIPGTNQKEFVYQKTTYYPDGTSKVRTVSTQFE